MSAMFGSICRAEVLGFACEFSTDCWSKIGSMAKGQCNSHKDRLHYCVPNWCTRHALHCTIVPTCLSYSMHSYVDDWRRCINRSPKTSLEVLFHVCPFDIGQYPAPLPRKHTSWDIAAKVVDTVLHMWHSRAIVQFHYVTTRWLERPVWHRNDMTRYTVDFDPSSHGYIMNI